MPYPDAVLRWSIRAYLAVFLGYLLFGHDIEDGAVQLSGIIGSVLGAIVLLLIWRAFSDRHRGTHLTTH